MKLIVYNFLTKTADSVNFQRQDYNLKGANIILSALTYKNILL